ncbi:predicted protein [Coccidioides posadasii str. Silveira]|uniref:Predicted protein n=2 Tax=Coccidioides posadasii TaxID=199306 RepID=E9D0C9_COCPS|nr:predicted protein [Coccidioides posadasii str. Silveira]KMM73056.1 hypothetical protein CPAG_09345 [Coccidioides posadasii RMSCC 3488]
MQAVAGSALKASGDRGEDSARQNVRWRKQHDRRGGALKYVLSAFEYAQNRTVCCTTAMPAPTPFPTQCNLNGLPFTCQSIIFHLSMGRNCVGIAGMIHVYQTHVVTL